MKEDGSSAQGQITEDRLGSCCVRGGCDRPADQPQDGAVRATQSYRGHRRPACLEAATQPRDGCAEDVRIRPVRRAHLDQGVRGAEAGSALAAANVSLWGGLRESAMLDPSGQYPWAAVRRAQCSILCSRSRIRGTGTPPGFSAGNNWKSQKLTPLLPNARTKGRVSGHRRPKCSE